MFLLCLHWAHTHFCTWGVTLASTSAGLPLFPRSLSPCDMELMSMWTGQSLVMTGPCWQSRKMLQLMEMPASTVRKEHLRECSGWSWHVSFLSTHGEVRGRTSWGSPYRRHQKFCFDSSSEHTVARATATSYTTIWNIFNSCIGSDSIIKIVNLKASSPPMEQTSSNVFLILALKGLSVSFRL